MRNVARFRSTYPVFAIVASAVLASFASGIGVGMLATLPAIAQPAQVEPCAAAADPIACLISKADDEKALSHR